MGKINDTRDASRNSTAREAIRQYADGRIDVDKLREILDSAPSGPDVSGSPRMVDVRPYEGPTAEAVARRIKRL